MPAPPSLKARALACLALREHSPSELRRKLLDHAARQQASALASAAPGAAEPNDGDLALLQAAQVDAVIDRLLAQGLLSEERFVASRVRVRAQRYGNRRIHAELAWHGLSADAHTAAELAASEIERAREVWARKFGGPAPDAAARAKQMRFLAGRGFSAEVIHRVVNARDHD